MYHREKVDQKRGFVIFSNIFIGLQEEVCCISDWSNREISEERGFVMFMGGYILQDGVYVFLFGLK